MSSEHRLLIEALPGYEVGDEIGRGGWGVVYAASHRSLKRPVAVKALPRAFGADPSVRARFLAEAQVVAALDHPHIVPLYDFVEHEGLCLLVMELMPGGTLWDRFSDHQLRPEQACAVTIAMLTGLDHAHSRDILHRDVKPENVLFNASGVPKLADFGIAKVIGDTSSQRTATGVIMGTPAYMAPEQGSGRPVSAATDVYAVGAMLYELMSGRLPFESTGDALSQLYRHVHEHPRPVQEIAESVPAPVAEVIMRALEKEPADRFESAADFARALNTAAAGGYGPDWLERTDVPVLAQRSTLGASSDTSRAPAGATVVLEPPARPAPSTPPPSATSAPGAAAPPATPPPPSSPAAAPPPSAAPRAAAPLPSASHTSTPAAPDAAPPSPATAATGPLPAGPPPTGPPPAGTPPPAAPPAAAAAAAAPSAAPVAAEAGAGGRGSGRPTGAIVAAAIVVIALVVGAALLLTDRGDDEAAPPAGPEQVPAAQTQRFETNCIAGGVDPELCRCALDAALSEMSVAEFIAAEQVLNADGEGLTADLETIFERCRDQAGA